MDKKGLMFFLDKSLEKDKMAFVIGTISFDGYNVQDFVLISPDKDSAEKFIKKIKKAYGKSEVSEIKVLSKNDNSPLIKAIKKEV